MNKYFFNKYRTMSDVAKAAIWFTICNLLIKGISIFSSPVFTRIIPESEYGMLTIMASYEQLIIIFATWEIQLGAYQKGLFKYKININLFTSSTQCITSIITIACFLIVFLFHNQITDLSRISNWNLVFVFVFLLVYPAYQCWLMRKRYFYKYKEAVTVTLFYSLMNIIIPMLAVLLLDRTAEVKYRFTLLTSISICLPFYIQGMNLRKLIKSIDKVIEQWKFLLHYQGPLVLHSLSYLVLSQADRIMIGIMIGTSQAGFYSVAYNLANVVNIFQNSINQVLTPWRYKKLEEKEFDRIKSTTNILLCMIGILILIFVLISPEIMKVLYAENYYQAVWCIPPVSASVYFMFLYSVFVNIETYFEKTKYVMYASIICGLINIGLNYFFINWFGYIAAGYTTLFTYVLFAIAHYYFMKKICSKEMPVIKLFSKYIILLISIAVIILTIGITALYPYPLIRYTILFIMGMFILLCRKKMISFLLKYFKERKIKI